MDKDVFFQMLKEFFFSHSLFFWPFCDTSRIFFFVFFHSFLSRLFHLVAFISFIKFNLIWIFFAFSIEKFFFQNEIKFNLVIETVEKNFHFKIKSKIKCYDLIRFIDRPNTHTHTWMMVNETDVSDSCSKWKFLFFFISLNKFVEIFFPFSTIDQLID